MEGYRGVSRDAMDRGVGEVQIKYRSLTTQEAEDHEIAAGDTAVVCEVYQLRAWNLAQRMGQPYEPISGVGVVRKVEKYDKKSVQRWDDSAKRYVPLPESGWRFLTLEGGMTWRKKAQNRAYKEALRHVPGAHASAAEVLEEATIHGMTEQPPEAAHLTMEQAIAWAKQHESAGPDWDGIEEGEFTEVKPDHNDPDLGAIAQQRAANDAAFEQLPSASAERAPADRYEGGKAERAGGNGKQPPANGRPQWKDADSAIDWGNAQGCFDHRNHAENAWNKVVTAIKAEHAPAIPTYAQVFDAWYADVQRRVLDHNAKIDAALDAQAAGDEMPVFESR